ncbi:MAG: hypothetical protein KGJ57_07565 [Sphingomonadales bacterium]|nr:hypothetical protein [Sphingomonadales bacterium]MDE2169270.1 hypothetical protein [Sphingomonadales bacterium]
MAPAPKWQESGLYRGRQMVSEAMGARTRVRRVPWHPAQPHDLRRFIAAAPVRTVHYNTATAVRLFLRSDFSLRCLAPEGARPFPGTGKALVFSPAARRQAHPDAGKQSAVTS